MGNNMPENKHELSEDESRGDLTDALAVIVSLPTEWADGRPHEDMSLGGAWALYGYGPGSPQESLAREFLESFAAIVDEATRGLSAEALVQRIAARPYHVGPAADGLPVVIVTALQDARPFLTDAALLWTLGQATKACISGLKALLDRLGVSYWNPDRPPLVFTEPMILGLCYAHVRDTYHPRASIEMESHFRAEFPGYGSPEQPGGMEHYLVRAKVGRRTYFLAVDSHAVVTDHYLIDGTSLTMLPLPNWTGQGYLPREVGQHVRTVKVPRRKR